jgi:hypothetical protein
MSTVRSQGLSVSCALDPSTKENAMTTPTRDAKTANMPTANTLCRKEPRTPLADTRLDGLPLVLDRADFDLHVSVIYTEFIGEAVLVLVEDSMNTCEVELLCLLRCLCVS